VFRISIIAVDKRKTDFNGLVFRCQRWTLQNFLQSFDIFASVNTQYTTFTTVKQDHNIYYIHFVSKINSIFVRTVKGNMHVNSGYRIQKLNNAGKWQPHWKNYFSKIPGTINCFFNQCDKKINPKNIHMQMFTTSITKSVWIILTKMVTILYAAFGYFYDLS